MAAESNSSGRRQRVVVSLGLLVVVGAVIGLFVWRIKPVSEPAEIRLSDGSTVRIEKITFGAEHFYSTDPIRDKLRQYVPKQFERFVGKTAFRTTMQRASNSIVIWMTRMDAVPNRVTPGNDRYYTKDRHGCIFPATSWTSRRIQGGSIVSAEFNNFPRGDGMFEYVIVDRRDNVIAWFKINNPFVTERKAWVPEKVPISKTNGGLVAELRGIDSIAFPQTPFDPDIRLIAGPELETWQKRPIRMFDATGNVYPGTHDAFCKHESLWKIEADFYRKPRARFRPEETWTITNLAIPDIGGIDFFKLSKNIDGSRLAVLSFQGAGYSEAPRPMAAPSRTIPPEAPILAVLSEQLRGESKLLVKARDDTGRTLVVWKRGESFAGMGGGTRHEFDIYALPDSKWLDLEVVLQKPVTFEFFVEARPGGRVPVLSTTGTNQ